MQIDITGHHVDISPALRDYVYSKMERVMRHFDNLIDVHCILTVEKLQHKAEATLRVAGGTLHAEGVEEDMYAAIDSLADRLDRQVRRHKDKLTDHHAGDASRQGLA
jgi:putative sigma-54 modulation protein